MSRIDYVLNTYAITWHTSQLPEWIEALKLQTVGGDSGRPIFTSTSISRIYNLRRPPSDSHGSCLEFGMRKLGSLALSYMYQLTGERSLSFVCSWYRSRSALIKPRSRELLYVPQNVSRLREGLFTSVHAMRARYRTFGPSIKSIVRTLQQYFFHTNSHQLL